MTISTATSAQKTVRLAHGAFPALDIEANHQVMVFDMDESTMARIEQAATILKDHGFTNIHWSASAHMSDADGEDFTSTAGELQVRFESDAPWIPVVRFLAGSPAGSEGESWPVEVAYLREVFDAIPDGETAFLTDDEDITGAPAFRAEGTSHRACAPRG